MDELLQATHADRRVGSVMFHGVGLAPGTGTGAFISLPADPILAASLLYDTLFRLDRIGLDLILVEWPPETPEWAAVRDRLTRAAARD